MRNRKSEYVRLQINKVTSWIDGSFVYSSSEAWANTMRAFRNGSLLMEETRQFPVRNTMRAPLFNHAVPHVMRLLSPERLYRKRILRAYINSINIKCSKFYNRTSFHLFFFAIANFLFLLFASHLMNSLKINCNKKKTFDATRKQDY